MDWKALAGTLLGDDAAAAAGLAVAVSFLTIAAGALLNPARREELALWLMGAEEQGAWARRFNTLFDALFGTRHFSSGCFLRSAVASLFAAALIWTLMGGVGVIGERIAALPLWSVLVAALAVNILADWLSLLETRWLLGRLERWTHPLAQAAVLLADLVVSGAIVGVALFAYVTAAPWLPSWSTPPGVAGEGWDFASILGVFSTLSVLFYSTFLTSVWSWLFVLSGWVLRLFVRLDLAHWLDVERRPVTILSLVLAGMTFLSGWGVLGLLGRGEDGLSLADRTLCTIFKGEVCLKVGGLTEDERAKLDLLLLACEGGVTEQCFAQGYETYEIKPREAARLFAASCDGGNAGGCTGLGYLHERGLGVDPDMAEAARLFRQGCDGGDALGCTNLGLLQERGLGMAPDPAESARLYRQGCDGGSSGGCINLGVLHELGLGMDPDPMEAARLYRQGCDGGNARGCTNLGILHERGLGVDGDPAEAARFYRQGCDGGNADGCTGLGWLHARGLGVDPDTAEAARLFHRGCDGGNAIACTNLGVLHEVGLGVDPDPSEAARLYRRGCEGEDADGCTGLGHLHERGEGVPADVQEALASYRRGCDGGSVRACAALERLGAQ